MQRPYNPLYTRSTESAEEYTQLQFDILDNEYQWFVWLERKIPSYLPNPFKKEFVVRDNIQRIRGRVKEKEENGKKFLEFVLNDQLRDVILDTSPSIGAPFNNASTRESTVSSKRETEILLQNIPESIREIVSYARMDTVFRIGDNGIEEVSIEIAPPLDTLLRDNRHARSGFGKMFERKSFKPIKISLKKSSKFIPSTDEEKDLYDILLSAFMTSRWQEHFVEVFDRLQTESSQLKSINY